MPSTIKDKIHLFLHKSVTSKMGKDLLWNYFSLTILGISGILVNIIIAATYGAKALGGFNQVYAIYIMASQLAVCGVHFSALKYVAQFFDDREKLDQIISAALLLGLIMGLSVSVVVFFSGGPVGGALLSSEYVSRGIPVMAPALLFFSINKVLFSVLNGLRRMVTFAIAQSFRYLLLVGIVAIMSLMKVPGYMLVTTFLGAEILLFFLLIFLTHPHFTLVIVSGWGGWFKKHFVFGVKGFASGLLVELNSRVDVLMLGFFLEDKIVGVYSFAAMLAEGLYQLAIIVRNNFSPILIRLIANGKLDEIKALVSRTQRLVYPAMLVVVLLLLGVFPFFINNILDKDEFMQGWSVLSILSISILAYSGFIPFNNIIIQAGLPGHHTLLTIMIVFTNILLNAMFIPVWHMNGAAVATGISYLMAIIFLNIMAQKHLKLGLVSFSITRHRC